MHKDQKRLFRQASQIYNQLKAPVPTIDNTFHAPHATWELCQAAWRRMQLANQHGWKLAAEALRTELQIALQRLRQELNDVDRFLESTAHAPHVSLGELYADLLALQEEFAEFTLDGQQQRLSVTTEPIELEDVVLGPFEIQLSWAAEPIEYRVVACEPHPAASNESLTHPHVQDETLCEGDGHLAIRLALQQRRLHDFFTIVANILRTYNSASPYLALSNWYGIDCSDCGSTMSDDASYSCDKCGVNVCSDCYFCCGDCDSILCNQCTGVCTECHEHHCSRCLQHCSECDQEFCQNCLHDQERCSDCHAKQDEESNEEPDSPQEPIASPAIHTDGLGEAALSA